MMNVKKKMVTYGEIVDKFMRGFKILKYKVDRYDVTYRPACSLADYKLQQTIEVDVIHLRKLNCTYVAMTSKGFLACFSCHKDDPTLVLRVDGLVDYDDIHRDDTILAALDEVYTLWDEKMHQDKEEP